MCVGFVAGHYAHPSLVSGCVNVNVSRLLCKYEHVLHEKRAYAYDFDIDRFGAVRCL